MRIDIHVMSALVFLIRVIRMMLIMQTLCGVNNMYTFSSSDTYNRPRENITMTPIFLPRLIFRDRNIGIGRKKRTRSVANLMPKEMLKNKTRSRHLPGVSGSHDFRSGIHCSKTTIVSSKSWRTSIVARKKLIRRHTTEGKIVR